MRERRSVLVDTVKSNTEKYKESIPRQLQNDLPGLEETDLSAINNKLGAMGAEYKNNMISINKTLKLYEKYGLLVDSL